MASQIIFRVITLLTVTTTLWIQQVAAVPPDRPVDIRAVEEKGVTFYKPTDSVFEVPISIKVAKEVKGISIRTEVMSVTPMVMKSLQEDKQEFKEAPSRHTVKVPVIKEKGIYKIELIGADLEGAVYSRIMLYQVVDENGARLYTQKQWRNERSKQRERKFKDSQSVRDFSGKLHQVKDEELKELKVDEGNPNALLVRPDNDPGRDRKYIKDGSKDAWRERDPITVRGRLVYTDFEGTVRPLVNAGVYLYDDDTFGDDFLGSVATNGNGEYSFSVNNDDGWLQNGRDIYIKLKLRNTRWRVHDGGDYEWSSDVRDDLSDGTVVDFGTLTPEDDQEAAQIFAFINRAWVHAVNVAGRDPGFVNIEYPADGDYFDGEVNISASSNRAPDIVIHEYGHFLMEAAYPGGDPSPGGAHNFGDNLQDARLSWSEGWATGFMLTQCNDGQYNWDEGTTEGAGEWPVCTNQNDAGGQAIERYSDDNRVGERQEGRVAAAILDFFDAANDDNGGIEDRGRNEKSDSNASNRVSLATMYNDTMWGSGHNDMIEYWQSLAGELSGGTLSDAARIMQYNWMSQPVDINIDCVASKVASAELKNPADILDGLRAFRDEALKPLDDGRRMIQIYYRHSPELAMLLIKNSSMRKDAVVVIEHFSKIGEASRNNQLLKGMLRENGPILPKNVIASAERIFVLIKKKGSKELQRDAALAQTELHKMAKLTWKQAIEAGEKRKRVKIDDATKAIKQHDLAPASKKADWKTIRKELPEIDSALQGKR